MKTFHPPSFVLGMISGLLILMIAVGGLRILRPSEQTWPAGDRAAFQQRPGGMGQNLSAMAGQLGMTEEELRAALESGKNLRELAEEKGVELPVGGRALLRQGPDGQVRGGSGAALTASGASVFVPRP